MICYFVFCCTVLYYYTTLSYLMLHYTILYHAVLCYDMLYSGMLWYWYGMLYYAMPWYAMLRFTLLYFVPFHFNPLYFIHYNILHSMNYIVLYYIILHYTSLYFITLYYILHLVPHFWITICFSQQTNLRHYEQVPWLILFCPAHHMEAAHCLEQLRALYMVCVVQWGGTHTEYWGSFAGLDGGPHGRLLVVIPQGERHIRGQKVLNLHGRH